MIQQALAGRRIAVTGSTGFLGTAVVERLLRRARLHRRLLVRSGRRTSAAQRGSEIIRNGAFGALRSILGDRFDEEIAPGHE